jgi:hypothetical protein
VADYAGISLPEVGALDYIQYLGWRRDAYIHRLEQTSEGREYLRNAWRMTQTKPDRAALRRKFGHKEV